MTKLIILGTSNAVPDQNHANTHMAVLSGDRFLLIDTGSDPIVRLQQAGLKPLNLTDLILTHFHPDHVSGVPTLLMSSWLMGRKNRLDIYGLQDTLQRTEQIMQLFEWSAWPEFFPVSFNNLPPQENALAFDSPEFRVSISPVCHMIPVIGVRIESHPTGKVAVYSCDTEPCDEVIRLAAEADILIHEATGMGFGHSSAFQAGEVAHQAGVKALYLIHYPTGDFDTAPLVEQAAQAFNGPIFLANDLMELEF